MPSNPHIIRIRRRREHKYRYPTFRRGGLSLALLVSLSILVIAFGVTSIYIFATRDLPAPEIISLQLEPPDGYLLKPTRFFDRSGEYLIHTIENPAIKERQYLQFRKGNSGYNDQEVLPSALISATVAISDPTFWTNPGFSLRSIPNRDETTLAEKLVLNMLLWDEPVGIRRDIRASILAAQITTEYGREKVMEWYLNNTDYSNLAYGAQAAAQIYFGVMAEDLNLTEVAILAAVAEDPALNPFDSPLTALERGKIVIDAMVGQGLITEEQATTAKGIEIKFQEPLPSKNTLAPAYLDLVMEQLSKTIPIDLLKRGGFDIITSLDYDLQVQTSCATSIHLARIQGVSGASTNQANDNCPASQLLPTINLDTDSTGATAFGVDLSADVTVMDPLTGQILAMISEAPSGSDEERIQTHPPGSLITPFIYLTAFTRGFSPASLVWDIPLDDLAVSLERSDPYEGPLRLRNALANDYWVPAIKVLQQIGLANVRQTASQLGLTSLAVNSRDSNTGDCLECKFVWQGDEITLIEAVQAFGVFANQGFLVGQASGEKTKYGFEPLRVTTVLNIQKAPTPLDSTPPDFQTRPVISRQLSYLVNHILSDETARWASLGHPNPLEIGRPAAVKMGRTQDGTDVWTIGYTSQLVVGVWMGTPPQSEKIEIPPKVASTLWHAIIQSATQDLPVSDWLIPEGMTTMDVCDPSGMLPTLQCPTVVSEIFINGQEPTQPDNLYRTYSINKETGRLATVFTPPELIEELIFLNVPPEAVTWAESVGLETPPATYDVIYTPSMLPDAQIEHPTMFSTLHGEVVIKGTAHGDDFVSYRLQAGEGLNPEGWTVVEKDRSTPVVNDKLGTWDTSELEGLYALQLIVLRENQRVDTTTIQVTIDNHPPMVVISYPVEGQTINSLVDKTITFLVNASDNMGIAEIKYKLDGRLIATQNQTPYAYLWEVTAGEHILTVEAIDRAGNKANASLPFKVE